MEEMRFMDRSCWRWDGEYSLFDIADVKERELKQFGNLKQVAVNGLAEPAFVRSLRMQGIRVTDRFDEQDYACESCSTF